jgi:protein SCO1
MKLPGKLYGNTSSVLMVMLSGICLLAAAIGGCQSGESTESIDAVNKADCLPAIKLVDQHSDPVQLSSLKGKLVLINFIYTSCPGPCLTETSKMAIVADRLGTKLGTKVTLVSVTVDPEHDGPRSCSNTRANRTWTKPDGCS